LRGVAGRLRAELLLEQSVEYGRGQSGTAKLSARAVLKRYRTNDSSPVSVDRMAKP